MERMVDSSYDYKGKKYSLRELADKLGVSHEFVRMRYNEGLRDDELRESALNNIQKKANQITYDIDELVDWVINTPL